MDMGSSFYLGRVPRSDYLPAEARTPLSELFPEVDVVEEADEDTHMDLTDNETPLPSSPSPSRQSE